MISYLNSTKILSNSSGKDESITGMYPISTRATEIPDAAMKV